MPDPQKLIILTALREDKRITLEQMATYCGLNSRKGRESVSKWEQGVSRPRANRRPKFIQYLCVGLELDQDTFDEVWQIIEEEWLWEPLSETEHHRFFGDKIEPGYADDAITADIAATGQPVVKADTPEERNYRRNRQAMLERVKFDWVTGVLEQSLYKDTLIELGLDEVPAAIETPWQMVMQTSDHDRRPVPAGTPVSTLFESMGRALLILGEPGAGKTTLLLELARDTIAQAEKDPHQPIPVVFNLSSWQDRSQPIAMWLLDELNNKYFIPHKIAQQWLDNNELLLLLDGLDEVAADLRQACVEAINQFRRQVVMPLAICSRTTDYKTLSVKLNLSNAVLIQPLTADQINDYFNQIGADLTPVQNMVQNDTALQELAHSPLMLSIITLAYQKLPAKEIQSLNTVEFRRRQLFDAYVAKMFKRRENNQRYTPEQATRGLTWLAKKMEQQSQTIFLIERMQPVWLSTTKQRQIYTLVSRLLLGLTLGVLTGISAGVSTTWNGMIFGLLTALSITLCVGLVDAARFALNSKIIKDKQTVGKLHSTGVALGSGLIIMLTIALTVMISGVLSFWFMEGLLGGLRMGLVLGLVFGLIMGLKGKRRNLNNDIQTTETLHFSSRLALKGAIFGFAGGLLTGIAVALNSGSELNLVTLEIGISFGLVASLIVGTFSGLNSKVISLKISPNQGIHLSARNALLIGLGLGLTAGAISEILGFVRYNGGLAIGLLIGIIAAIWYGGLDVVKHYTLRLILYRNNYAPWQYSRFLDYATERLFLNKVGGGYIFRHRTLMEYFANLPLEKTKNKRFDRWLVVAAGILVITLLACGYSIDLHKSIITTFYSNKGHYYLRAGNFESAFNSYSRAAEIQPDYGWHWSKLCVMGIMQSPTPTIINACNKAVQMAPDKVPVYDNRGVVRALNGNYSGAIDDFSHVQDPFGKSPKATVRQIWMADLKQGRNPFNEEILHELRQIIRYEPYVGIE